MEMWTALRSAVLRSDLPTFPEADDTDDDEDCVTFLHHLTGLIPHPERAGEVRLRRAFPRRQQALPFLGEGDGVAVLPGGAGQCSWWREAPGRRCALEVVRQSRPLLLCRPTRADEDREAQDSSAFLPVGGAKDPKSRTFPRVVNTRGVRQLRELVAGNPHAVPPGTGFPVTGRSLHHAGAAVAERRLTSSQVSPRDGGRCLRPSSDPGRWAVRAVARRSRLRRGRPDARTAPAHAGVPASMR